MRAQRVIEKLRKRLISEGTFEDFYTTLKDDKGSYDSKAWVKVDDFIYSTTQAIKNNDKTAIEQFKELIPFFSPSTLMKVQKLGKFQRIQIINLVDKVSKLSEV